jgi:hypothetical protein
MVYLLAESEAPAVRVVCRSAWELRAPFQASTMSRAENRRVGMDLELVFRSTSESSRIVRVVFQLGG